MIRALQTLFLAMVIAGGGVAVAADNQDVPGVTEDTIKIGVPAPFSGPYSVFGAAGYAIAAYYEYVNEHGGIHGRKIEVVLADTACEEGQGIATIKRLIYQEDVFLINGLTCSGVGLAVRPVIAETNVPLVVSTAANQNISEPVVNNIFHAVQTSRDFGEAMVKFALSKPGTERIAIVAHSNEWAKGYIEPAKALLEKQEGVKVVADVALERGATDATAQVLRLKQANADFILVTLYGPELGVFLRDAQKFGLDVPMIGSLGADYLKTQERLGGPAAMQNFYMVHQYRGLLNSPQLADFRRKIANNLPEGQSITDFTFYGPGSAVVVAHVLKQIGPNPTREKFIEAMEHVQNFDTGILAGTITFTPGDHQGVDNVYVVGYDQQGELAIFKSWSKKTNLSAGGTEKVEPSGGVEEATKLSGSEAK